MNYTKMTHATMLALTVSFTACTKEGGADRAAIGANTEENVSVYANEPLEAPVDVRTENTPSMPNADYGTVTFESASSELTPEARKSLDQAVDNINGEQPVLLTLRLKDDDTIDATEPTDQFKILTPERVTAVKKYLQDSGVAIERVAVDEAGRVADFGEDNAMARAPERSRDEVQQLVITIATEQ